MISLGCPTASRSPIDPIRANRRTRQSAAGENHSNSPMPQVSRRFPKRMDGRTGLSAVSRTRTHGESAYLWGLVRRTIADSATPEWLVVARNSRSEPACDASAYVLKVGIQIEFGSACFRDRLGKTQWLSCAPMCLTPGITEDQIIHSVAGDFVGENQMEAL